MDVDITVMETPGNEIFVGMWIFFLLHAYFQNFLKTQLKCIFKTVPY